jgi:hypothetical protein
MLYPQTEIRKSSLKNPEISYFIASGVMISPVEISIESGVMIAS